MPNQNFLSRIILIILKKYFSLKENLSKDIGNPKNILIIRQHNQFGDLLASVSLLNALKEKFFGTQISVIVSPDNSYAITKNRLINRFFIFDKSKILNPFYFLKLRRFLNSDYDLAIVPTTVSMSLTSCILARISNAKIRIGPNSLNGQVNKYSFLFDRRVDIDWRKHPDAHISDFGLDIVRPFGINTKNYRSTIHFDDLDKNMAENFLSELDNDGKDKIIGLHVGAGKKPNRWSIENFIKLILFLNKEYKAKMYITGSNSDSDEIEYLKDRLSVKIGFFLNHSIPELAALISLSNLFITNDTGVMHVAGATDTPQISIFGPTNPYNWAPIGPNKYFVRNSESIDDVTVNEVFTLCRTILDEKNG